MSDLLEAPASIEAESSVIGGLLLGAPLEYVSSLLSAEDFFWALHRAAFAAMGIIVGKGETPDLLTVSEYLSQDENFKNSLGELAEIASNTVSTSNIIAYAKIIKDKAVQRELLGKARQICEEAYNGKLTTDEQIAKAQQLILSVGSRNNDAEVVAIGDPLKRFIDELDARSQKQTHSGIDTGYPAYDNFIRGYRPGHVHIIAGRPGTGKTTFGINICENLAKEGKKSLIFSLEMPTQELIERIVSSTAEIPKDAMDTGKLDSGHWDKLTAGFKRIQEMPIHICDKPGLDISRIRALARFRQKTDGLDLILIDHIGLIKTPKERGSSRTIELGEVSRQIKEMAKELNLPVIELVQLNREMEKRADKTPNMSDIRDSGDIEQDADTITFLYRDQHSGNGLTVATVAKNRHGKTGRFNLILKGEFSRFDSCGAMSVDEPKNLAEKYG